MALYPFLRPLAFALDAETAHRATIQALKLMPSHQPPPVPAALRMRVAGLDFPSPVGLAAGFDKNAEVPEQMLSLGFGFVEVGTLTPRPQAGNPRPRLFRLAEDRGVINRLGFNNDGQPAAFDRLQRCAHRHEIIGVNVGANKDSMATSRGAGRQDGLSDGRIADYVHGVQAMAPVARYLTINISSPNTPGLRGLQDEGALDELLAAVQEAGVRKPLFLKVAPDLEPGDAKRIVRAAIDRKIAALIVGNTTVSRPALNSRHAHQQGGLSGRPLKPLALDTLRAFRAASGGEIPLVGVGGIATAEDAWERICAGASLIQLYTAMVFDGPGIARRIVRGLAHRLRGSDFNSIAEAVGSAT